MKSNIRELNGYRLLYSPDHPSSMKNECWDGYVYEHIAVVEKYLGRGLTDDEVIHHLDENRSNNRIENLLVLERGQHWKLHRWLEAGALRLGSCSGNGLNSGKAKPIEPAYCQCCGITLQGQQELYCSHSCCSMGVRKAIRPSRAVLKMDIDTMSFLAIGRKYGVTDNAVRKWARRYGLIGTPILSQSSGTPEAGAETTGGVQTP